jgi:hypothetical protein
MATAECIHGFEPGFCDICFPREQALPNPAATRIAQAKRSATLGSRTPPNAPRNRTIAPSLIFSAQRIYHVTHIDNLTSILAGGVQAGVVPYVDVSSPTTRELRETVDLLAGGTVASHVPFFLSPHANRWLELRAGAIGTHWSDAARESSPTEYVILVADAGSIGPDVVLADSDASSPEVRFAHGLDDSTAQLRRMRAIDDEYRDAEVLAPSPFPIENFTLIGVANEPMRDRVKALLADAAGTVPRVAVYPPWFTVDPA